MMCMKMYELHGPVTKQIQEVTLSSQCGLKFCQGMFASCLPSLNMAFLQSLNWVWTTTRLKIWRTPEKFVYRSNLWSHSSLQNKYTGCVPFSNNIHWTNLVNFWGSMDSHIVWTHPNMTGLLGELSNTTAAWLCLESGDQAPGGRGCLPEKKMVIKPPENQGNTDLERFVDPIFQAPVLESIIWKITIYAWLMTGYLFVLILHEVGRIRLVIQATSRNKGAKAVASLGTWNTLIYIYIYVKIWYKCMYIYDIIFICTHMML